MGLIGTEAAALFSASHEPEATSAVLHIFLRVIEARLRDASGCVRGRLGAVSFVQRFGSTLNAHVHFHCCVIDEVFPDRHAALMLVAARLRHIAATRWGTRAYMSMEPLLGKTALNKAA